MALLFDSEHLSIKIIKQEYVRLSFHSRLEKPVYLFCGFYYFLRVNVSLPLAPLTDCHAKRQQGQD